MRQSCIGFQEDVVLKHTNKKEEFCFSAIQYSKGFARKNVDLRLISEVVTDGSAKVQVGDIIQSFQICDNGATRTIDLENYTMTQEEWYAEMEALRKKCSVENPLKITFRRGLKILQVPTCLFSRTEARRRLSALSERFCRVREFQTS